MTIRIPTNCVESIERCSDDSAGDSTKITLKFTGDASGIPQHIHVKDDCTVIIDGEFVYIEH